MTESGQAAALPSPAMNYSITSSARASNDLMQNFKSLRDKPNREKGCACDVPAGLDSRRDRIRPGRHRQQRRSEWSPSRSLQSWAKPTLALHQVRSQRGKPIFVRFCIPRQNPHIPAFNKALLVKALEKRRRYYAGALRTDAQEVDHRHRQLLRLRHEGPRCRTAKPCNEFAPSCMTRKEHTEG
jgi:hypothetical protein